MRNKILYYPMSMAHGAGCSSSPHWLTLLLLLSPIGCHYGCCHPPLVIVTTIVIIDIPCQSFSLPIGCCPLLVVVVVFVVVPCQLFLQWSQGPIRSHEATSMNNVYCDNGIGQVLATVLISKVPVLQGLALSKYNTYKHEDPRLVQDHYSSPLVVVLPYKLSVLFPVSCCCCHSIIHPASRGSQQWQSSGRGCHHCHKYST